MANAKKCDICGKFYAAHKLSRKLRGLDMRDTSTVVLLDLDYQETDDVFDINSDKVTMETCPECMAKIKKFIESMKNDSEEH
jgi:hypothetical protein